MGGAAAKEAAARSAELALEADKKREVAENDLQIALEKGKNDTAEAQKTLMAAEAQLTKAKKEAEISLKTISELKEIKEEDEKKAMIKAKEEEEIIMNQAYNAEREELANYKLGSLTSMKSVPGLDFSDITTIRIGLFGPTGSGKSCFVNTCERALKRKDQGTCQPQDSGGEGTVILGDYLTDFPFLLVDTRGFFAYNVGEIREFMHIIDGDVRVGEYIKREENVIIPDREASLSEKLHAVIVLLKANDPRLTSNELVNYLKIPREELRIRGIAVVTLVTHADLIPMETMPQILTTASKSTGSPANQTFFISNYTVDGSSRKIQTEMECFKVLRYTLTAAERFLKISKQRQAYKDADNKKAGFQPSK